MVILYGGVIWTDSSVNRGIVSPYTVLRIPLALILYTCPTTKLSAASVALPTPEGEKLVSVVVLETVSLPVDENKKLPLAVLVC